MQIDFHHATVYVLSRWAGFDPPKAKVVAYSSQYVDDAAHYGVVHFKNKALYSRIRSTHSDLLSNLMLTDNYYVWIPFHFLPGNENRPQYDGQGISFIDKIICRPNSFIAQDMMNEAVLQQHQPYGLHRFGIAIHVYADTWAHQGFAGIRDPINLVSGLDDDNPTKTPKEWVLEKSKDTGRWLLSRTIGVWPVGHGTVVHLPDLPYCNWHYNDKDGELIRRNNTEDFLAAADEIYKTMKRYLVGDPDLVAAGLDSTQIAMLRQWFTGLTSADGSARHAVWLDQIGKNTFKFADFSEEDRILYDPMEWKQAALGSVRAGIEYDYNPAFLTSDWKLFHDALQVHKLFVLHDLLPRYGICAA